MSFLEPEVESSPFRDALLLVEARWRGIVLSFILILALWLVVQAFVTLHDAYVYVGQYVGQNVPKLNDLSEEILPKYPTQSPTHMTPPPITSCWRDRSLSGDDCFRAWGGSAPPPPPAQVHKPLPRRRSPNCDCAEI